MQTIATKFIFQDFIHAMDINDDREKHSYDLSIYNKFNILNGFQFDIKILLAL